MHPPGPLSTESSLCPGNVDVAKFSILRGGIKEIHLTNPHSFNFYMIYRLISHVCVCVCEKDSDLLTNLESVAMTPNDINWKVGTITILYGSRVVIYY